MTVLQYEIHITHETILSVIHQSMSTTEAKALASRIINDFATGASSAGISQKLASSHLSRQQSEILKQILVIG